MLLLWSCLKVAFQQADVCTLVDALLSLYRLSGCLHPPENFIVKSPTCCADLATLCQVSTLMVCVLSTMLSVCMQVAFQKAEVCKLVGALLSQVSQLPQQQLQLWWCAQEPQQEQQPQSGFADHHSAIAQWLRQCVAALQTDNLPQLQTEDDPVNSLLAWALGSISNSQQGYHRQGPKHHTQPGQQQQHHQQSQQQERNAQERDVQDSSNPQHPAKALRQLLDVLLSALLYRHLLTMNE